MSSLKSEYLLDPKITFLNHGSFGACPKPVFKCYQKWQRELEKNPVAFIQGRLPKEIEKARCILADYLGAGCGEVVYFTNPTTAFNMVTRSLELQPGDEILTTCYEYPAMLRTWEYVCHRTGARLVQQPTPLPLLNPQDFIEAFWSGVTSQTRIIFLSHIAAFIAMIFPVQEICQKARQAGILTIIDGAHAPGQIPLNLRSIDPDFYVGACHKWLSAPKGSGFLYARLEAQTQIEPLVISTGWLNKDTDCCLLAPDGHTWLVYFNEAQGTRDPSAFLSVPTAITFQKEHDWHSQQARCHTLASQTRQRLNEITGFPALCPDEKLYFNQMVSVEMPAERIFAISQQLQKERIVVPVLLINGHYYMRISFQAYNDESDAEHLVRTLREVL